MGGESLIGEQTRDRRELDLMHRQDQEAPCWQPSMRPASLRRELQAHPIRRDGTGRKRD